MQPIHATDCDRADAATASGRQDELYAVDIDGIEGRALAAYAEAVERVIKMMRSDDKLRLQACRLAAAMGRQAARDREARALRARRESERQEERRRKLARDEAQAQSREFERQEERRRKLAREEAQDGVRAAERDESEPLPPYEQAFQDGKIGEDELRTIRRLPFCIHQTPVVRCWGDDGESLDILGRPAPEFVEPTDPACWCGKPRSRFENLLTRKPIPGREGASTPPDEAEDISAGAD